MSSTEFARWRSFELLEGPLGQYRNEAMLAVVGAQVANAVTASVGGKARIRPADLIPDWDRAPRGAPRVARIEAQLHSLTEAFKEG